MANYGKLNESLWRAGPLLAAAIAVAAAIAFYLGWAYEKAYVEEWGLSFSGFSYSPYELMVASTTTLFWAAVTPLGFAMGYFSAPTIDWMSGGPPTTRESRIVIPLLVGAIALMSVSAAIREDWALFYLFLWISVVLAASTAWRYRSHDLALQAFLGLILAGTVLIALVPGVLGRDDAMKDRENPNRLPLVTLILDNTGSTHLSEIVKGRWRLIRINDGNLWLAPDQENPTRVIEISAENFDSVTYLDDE